MITKQNLHVLQWLYKIKLQHHNMMMNIMNKSEYDIILLSFFIKTKQNRQK